MYNVVVNESDQFVLRHASLGPRRRPTRRPRQSAPATARTSSCKGGFSTRPPSKCEGKPLNTTVTGRESKQWWWAGARWIRCAPWPVISGRRRRPRSDTGWKQLNNCRFSNYVADSDRPTCNFAQLSMNWRTSFFIFVADPRTIRLYRMWPLSSLTAVRFVGWQQGHSCLRRLCLHRPPTSHDPLQTGNGNRRLPTFTDGADAIAGQQGPRRTRIGQAPVAHFVPGSQSSGGRIG